MVTRALAVLALALTGGCATEARDARLAPCGPGDVRVEGECVPASVAYVGAGGTAYHVDAAHPVASDDGPGSAGRPWRTISRAARRGALRPGDAVLIHGGVYRESVRPATGGTGPGARITYAAMPGETVVVTGADPADEGWEPLGGGRWRRPWTGPPLPTYADEPVFRRELVVAGGRVLQSVTRPEDLKPGSLWAEGPPEAPRALVVRFPADASPAGAGPVDVGHRTVLFAPLGPDAYADCGDPATPGWIRLVGLTFRHATNRAQWGAICAGSRGGLVENVTVEWTNGKGIDVSGRGHVFRQSRADHNGQLGWGGACTGCLFEDGTAIGNNWKGYDPFWEAGGGKWYRTSESVIRGFTVTDNEGPGIWLDIDNRDNTVERSCVERNAVAGIMLELRTTGTLVQHNVVRGTRARAWSGAGLLSQAASHNAVVHNTITGNEGTGVWVRLDPLRRAPDGHTVVLNNRVVGNARGMEEAREVQVEGTSRAHLRTNRFDSNVYGVHTGDPVWRSTFFALTLEDGEYRGHGLSAWRRWTGGDRASHLGTPTSRPTRAIGVAPGEVGAPSAPYVSAATVGAGAVPRCDREP